MNIRWLGMILLLFAHLVSAQTVYRTVTGNGKVVYSDTPMTNDSQVKMSQVQTYSEAALGGTNSTRPLDGGGEGSASLTACQGDAQRFCSGRTGKQAFDCLLDRQQEVSDACYNAMKAKMQGGQKTAGGQEPQGPAGLQACREDAQRFCKNVQPGEGRIMNCLLDFQQKVSDTCYNTLAKKMKAGR